MNSIIYMKYNNTRRAAFATRTLIFDDGGSRVVEKSALFPEGKEHIKGLEKSAALAESLYKNARPVDVTILDDAARFPFISGSSAASVIEQNLSHLSDAVSLLKEFMEVVGDYRDEMLSDFFICDDFYKIFGNIDYKGPAVRCAQIDEIPDNFIHTKDGLFLIDYEWTFPFAVPVRFIRFRTAYYFYIKHQSIIQRQSPEADNPDSDGGEEYFLGLLGFEKEEIELWKKTEENFQRYVHGEDNSYSYPLQYEKTIFDVNHFLNDVPDVAGEHHRLVCEMTRLGELLRPKNYPKYLIERLKNRH